MVETRSLPLPQTSPHGDDFTQLITFLLLWQENRREESSNGGGGQKDSSSPMVGEDGIIFCVCRGKPCGRLSVGGW